MDIKRSAIQPSFTAQNSETQSSTSTAKTTPQTGIASSKDSFESVKQSPFQTNAAQIQTTAAPSSIQLPAVQKQMTSYLSGNDPGGNVFGMMMEYQKMMNKEARQDRATARQDSKLELASKSAKLGLESKKIGEAKTEAAARFGSAMAEASSEYLIGTSGKLLKGDVKNDIDVMSKSLDELKNSASEIMEKLVNESKSDDEVNSVNSRYKYLISWLTDDDKP
jgi:hypothetical protein